MQEYYDFPCVGACRDGRSRPISAPAVPDLFREPANHGDFLQHVAFVDSQVEAQIRWHLCQQNADRGGGPHGCLDGFSLREASRCTIQDRPGSPTKPITTPRFTEPATHTALSPLVATQSQTPKASPKTSGAQDAKQEKPDDDDDDEYEIPLDDKPRPLHQSARKKSDEEVGPNLHAERGWHLQSARGDNPEPQEP